jgi:hypothetical protein
MSIDYSLDLITQEIRTQILHPRCIFIHGLQLCEMCAYAYENT